MKSPQSWAADESKTQLHTNHIQLINGKPPQWWAWNKLLHSLYVMSLCYMSNFAEISLIMHLRLDKSIATLMVIIGIRLGFPLSLASHLYFQEELISVLVRRCVGLFFLENPRTCTIFSSEFCVHDRFTVAVKISPPILIEKQHGSHKMAIDHQFINSMKKTNDDHNKRLLHP